MTEEETTRLPPRPFQITWPPLDIVTVRLMTPESKLRWQAVTELLKERTRQNELWGKQVMCLRSSGRQQALAEECARAKEDEGIMRAVGSLTWAAVLYEEVLEAFSASSLAELREELVQVAAVAVQMIERIDSGELSLEPGPGVES